MRKILFILCASTILMINLAINAQSNNGNLSLAQIFKISFANAEDTGCCPCYTINVSEEENIHVCLSNPNYEHGYIKVTTGCSSGQSGSCSVGTVTQTYYCDGTCEWTGSPTYVSCN